MACTFSRPVWKVLCDEVPNDVMRKILARAPLAGWRGALMEHEGTDGSSDFRDVAVSQLRSGFKFLLDRFESGSVLEYRCGLGAVTTSLARNFATVYATDPSDGVRAVHWNSNPAGKSSQRNAF